MRFTHKCGVTRSHGWFAIVRDSILKRMRSKSRDVEAELRKRRHRPVGETGRWLRHDVQGNSNRRCRIVGEVTKMAGGYL